MLKRFDERLVSVLLIFGSAAMLGGALFFQEVMDLPPCILCKYQRIPYVIAIVLGTLAYITRNKAQILFLSLTALALFVNAGIAGFHVGVEHQWWEGTAECGMSFPAGSIEALRAAVLSAPIVRCTDIPWSLFGISMAGYNMMAALGMAIFAALSVLHFGCKCKKAQKSEKA